MAIPMTGLLGTVNTEHPFWQWRFMIVGAVILLSSISAVGTVLLARRPTNASTPTAGRA
jgi:hypothetical protein